MTATVLTLQLGGDVSLHAFAEAVADFDLLVKELTDEIGAEVSWVISDAEPGSATVGATGESKQDETAPARVAAAYLHVAERIQRGHPILNPRVAVPARALQRLLGRDVAYIRFQAEQGDVRVTGLPAPDGLQPSFEALDAVEGIVKTVSVRGGPTFTLFDSIYDRGVNCYWEAGKEGELDRIFRRRVIVEGLVRRDSQTGVPDQVRNIREVRIVDEPPPGGYVRACGLLPWKPGDALPEDVVRTFRDG